MNAFTGNASDAKQVKEAAKKEKRSRDQELRDFRNILQTSIGRRWVWRLLESCGAFLASYTRGDSHETAFREGQRNIGNKVLADLMDADGSMFNLMREENTQEVEDAGTSSSGETERGSETGELNN